MIASGERMDFSALSRPTADKHSTGGVGDKITLPLAPLVAACGVAVPQLSGRGLGPHRRHPRQARVDPRLARGAVERRDDAPSSRTSARSSARPATGLAPADKKLYALRDVTGTVEAIPLIASSIMSKKIAEGTGALVLDVKVGTGAFMKDLDRARELAETMVALGTDAGVRTVALLTDMSTPLGLTAGNALEVAESVEVLAGGGPADVVELTLALAREMLAGAGVDRRRPGRRARRRLGDGRLEGDDPRPGRRPRRRRSRWPASRTSSPRPSTGVLTRLDAMAVGLAAWRLGAGRARKEDPVQAGAGVVLARPARRRGHRGGSRCFTLLTDEPAPLRARPRLARGWLRHRAAGHGVHACAAGHRPHPDRRPRPWTRLGVARTLAPLAVRRPASRQQQDDGLGDAGRLGLALDLDRVAEHHLLAGRQVGDLADRGVHADPAADRTGWGSGPC